jgi:hypothetical protein
MVGDRAHISMVIMRTEVFHAREGPDQPAHRSRRARSGAPYTARHGTSISRIVTEFLAGLPLEEERELAGLSPTVRRLIGAASGTDVAAWKEYLNEKYGA